MLGKGREGPRESLFALDGRLNSIGEGLQLLANSGVVRVEESVDEEGDEGDQDKTHHQLKEENLFPFKGNSLLADSACEGVGREPSLWM